MKISETAPLKMTEKKTERERDNLLYSADPFSHDALENEEFRMPLRPLI